LTAGEMTQERARADIIIRLFYPLHWSRTLLHRKIIMSRLTYFIH